MPKRRELSIWQRLSGTRKPGVRRPHGEAVYHIPAHSLARSESAAAGQKPPVSGRLPQGAYLLRGGEVNADLGRDQECAGRARNWRFQAGVLVLVRLLQLPKLSLALGERESQTFSDFLQRRGLGEYSVRDRAGASWQIPHPCPSPRGRGGFGALILGVQTYSQQRPTDSPEGASSRTRDPDNNAAPCESAPPYCAIRFRTCCSLRNSSP